MGLRVVAAVLFAATAVYVVAPVLGVAEDFFREPVFVANSAVKVALLGLACLYAAGDVKGLRFVRRAKSLGFTLPEIRELLALSDHRDDDMAAMKDVAIEKLADVEAKLAELERIRAGLKTLVASCPGHGALADCPILNALTEDAA